MQNASGSTPAVMLGDEDIGILCEKIGRTVEGVRSRHINDGTQRSRKAEDYARKHIRNDSCLLLLAGRGPIEMETRDSDQAAGNEYECLTRGQQIVCLNRHFFLS
ncbi:hypothetical protein H2248_007011 [Termitomyces sp. 'cryptogamus']|nr:hypothetical protein H2248_007011 [Termitomyces sp. 'cryptogamus']